MLDASQRRRRQARAFMTYSMLRKGLMVLFPVCLISQGHAQTGIDAPGQLPATGTPSTAEATITAAPPAAGAALSGFTFTAGVELSETYTNNGLGVARSSGLNSGSDFITSLRLNLGVHDRTARFQGDLQYSLAGYAYARHSSLSRVSNYLNALGRAVLVPEHVLLDVRAFAAPILINSLGSLSAEDRPI